MSNRKPTSHVYGESLNSQIRKGKMDPEAAKLIAPNASSSTRRMWDQTWKLRQAAEAPPKYLKIRKAVRKVGMFLIHKAAL